MVRKVRAGMMPPSGAPRPDRAQLDAFAAKLETELDRAAALKPNPGNPGLHRLNRTEYANAIRDLLALDVDAATLLPADDSSEGFDNIADALAVSPALLERYAAAAAKISRLAVGDPLITPSTATYRVPADLSQANTSRVCRWARAAGFWFTTPFRWTPNTLSRSAPRRRTSAWAAPRSRARNSKSP